MSLRRKIVTSCLAGAASIGLIAGSAAAAPAHREITTVKISVGRVLAATNGHVLYLFERDTKNHSNCDATCRMYWMPVKSKGAPTAGPRVSASHLALIKNGQVSYYGHPLYFYSGDTGPKEDNGQGSVASGGKWYVVGTGGKPIT